MKETILITGAGPNGVTGKRIKEQLETEYTILSPSSRELDLTDFEAVRAYFDSHKIDYVVHSAVVAPSRGHDASSIDKEVENNLRMFYNLRLFCDRVKKIFYLGSGAEFDKSLPIVNIKESELDGRMPKDTYGFIKYVMTQYARRSDNIYNIRLFGTINPYEPITRNVISNICAKLVNKQEVRLNRDCKFSFVDIDDVAKFIDRGIKNQLQFHDYNLSSGIFSIKEIANKLIKISNSGCKVSFSKIGMNNEYTADTKRSKIVIGEYTNIDRSLQKVYDYIYKNKEKIDIENIDNRWK